MPNFSSLFLPLTCATVLCLSWVAASAQILPPDKLFAKVSPSVWQVHTFDEKGERIGRGSAVVISAERVITNCHVIAKGRSVTVSRENVSHNASLEFPDPDRDLCQLRVKGMTAPAVDVANVSELRIGQKVFAVGNPLGMTLSLSDGLVSGLRLDKRDQLEAIQTSAPISSGSSGGGLFDDQARLIGITTFALSGREGAVAQNLNFAMPAHWIADVPVRGAINLAKLAIPPVAANQAPASSSTVPPSTPSAAGAASGQRRLEVAEQVPYLSPRGREGYREWLNRPFPRAFAVAPTGHYWASFGAMPRDPTVPVDIKDRALAGCQKNAGRPCKLYAVDDLVVWTE